MGLLRRAADWVEGWFAPRNVVRAGHDSARTTVHNRKHWQYTDSLSGKSDNSLDVRRTLRERAREERRNSGYARGLLKSLADDIVGVGPKPQVSWEGSDTDAGRTAAQMVERLFLEWADEVCLYQDAHLAYMNVIGDGEAFAVEANNPLLESPIKLAPMWFETDQISTPFLMLKPGKVDGVELDAWGRPAIWHVLKEHPGDQFTFTQEFSRVPAANMVHWMHRTRIGQVRGAPEIESALPLFAQLRRFTLATLTAAETAADYAAVLESDLSPNTDTAQESEKDFDEVPINRGVMVTVPRGYKLKQVDPKHPGPSFEMFKRELLKEVGRPVSAPYGTTAGDHSMYNYSSGKLDRGIYHAGARVSRSQADRNVWGKIFRWWFREALGVAGYLPAGVPERVRVTWRWPGFTSIEPQKEAMANSERLKTGQITFADLLAEDGKDWVEVFRQIAAEQKLLSQLGIVLGDPAKPQPDGTDDAATDRNGD